MADEPLSSWLTAGEILPDTPLLFLHTRTPLCCSYTPAREIQRSGVLRASEPETFWSVNSAGVHDAGVLSAATGMGNRSSTANVFFTDVAPADLTPALMKQMGIRDASAVFVMTDDAIRAPGA